MNLTLQRPKITFLFFIHNIEREWEIKTIRCYDQLIIKNNILNKIDTMLELNNIFAASANTVVVLSIYRKIEYCLGNTYIKCHY